MLHRAHAATIGAAAVVLVAMVLAAIAHAAEPNLTTGQWRIVEIGGKRVRVPSTMNFTRVGWLGVKTPCGPLWGWYRRSGTAIKIHIVGTGRREIAFGSPCQGTDYQLLLGRVRCFAVEDHRLVFRSDSGRALVRLERWEH